MKFKSSRWLCLLCTSCTSQISITKVLLNSTHILCRVLDWCVLNKNGSTCWMHQCDMAFIPNCIADIQTYSFVLEHMFTVTMVTNNCSMFTFCEMTLQIFTNYLRVTAHVAAVQNCKRTFCSVFLKGQDNTTLIHLI